MVDELIASCGELAQHQAILRSRLVAVADATPVAEFAPFEISAALTWITQAAAAAHLDLTST